MPDTEQRVVGRGGLEWRRGRGALDVAHQVGMGVDQPRQHGGIGQIQHPGHPGHRRPGGQDPFDPVAPDQDQLVPPNDAAVDVHQRSGLDQRQVSSGGLAAGHHGQQDQRRTEPPHGTARCGSAMVGFSGENPSGTSLNPAL